jgi:hypothetical protein
MEASLTHINSLKSVRCVFVSVTNSLRQLAATAGMSRWRFMTILLSAPR